MLLKEKNMLLTLEAEALRQDRFMPGEERLEKVRPLVHARGKKIRKG